MSTNLLNTKLLNANDIDYMISILNAVKKGTPIQYLGPDGEDGLWINGAWFDLEITGSFIPDFTTDVYRIKPEPNRYRVGLFKDNDFYYTMIFERNDERESKFLEQKPNFVKWLTDWIEYEV